MKGKSPFKVRYYNFGRIRRARMLTADKHAGQFRKERLSDKPLPVLIHTEGTAENLMAMGAEEDLVIAGQLHDALEDTDLTEEEILKQFGPNVLRLVKAMTEPKYKSWLRRKKYKIKALRTGDMDLKLLGAADHCDNLLSILEALYREGLSTAEEFAEGKVWANFKQDYKMQKWYHQESCKAIFANVPYEMLHPLFGKYMRIVEKLFGEQVIFDKKARAKVRRRKQIRKNE